MRFPPGNGRLLSGSCGAHLSAPVKQAPVDVLPPLRTHPTADTHFPLLGQLLALPSWQGSPVEAGAETPLPFIRGKNQLPSPRTFLQAAQMGPPGKKENA